MPNGQPSQLANLRSPWHPGQSGNPNGRPQGVTYPTEWMRGMAGMTAEAMRKIKDDPGEPVSRRIAAGMYLDALDGDTARTRKDATSEICDRTAGRPAQSVQVIAEGPRRSAQDLLDDLRKRYNLDPAQTVKGLPSE